MNLMIAKRRFDENCFEGKVNDNDAELKTSGKPKWQGKVVSTNAN
jgi:hypothetical protein